MKLPQGWASAKPLFDDENLISCAGLAPVMALAEQAGLSDLVGERVRFDSWRVVASAGVNPAGKIATIIAGMAAGADSIDDLQVVRSGGMKRMFGGVYAPATLGQFLREFSHGHAAQLASVARAHLIALAQRTGVLDGIETVAYVDIDSLLRPVYGKTKQGASFGHTKISGKQVLRRGLSPLAATISTEACAPVIAEVRLRGGKANSSRGAASMITAAIRTARAAGATGKVLVRGDSAFGSGAVVKACLDHNAQFSVVLVKNSAVSRAIEAIADDAWTPVRYPGAVTDPDTGELISDAQVAETTFTAFASTEHPVTARLIVRRVRDQAKLEELFPVWRYHPFFTNNDQPAAQADITHRRHAIIETVFADLIDGPIAHLPSSLFAANQAWTICAAMTHNLLRAAASLTDSNLALARGATLRTRIVNIPARIARPQRKRILHLPQHWPWATDWLTLWQRVFRHGPAPPLPT